jgi:hypothetical protein
MNFFRIIQNCIGKFYDNGDRFDLATMGGPEKQIINFRWLYTVYLMYESVKTVKPFLHPIRNIET